MIIFDIHFKWIKIFLHTQLYFFIALKICPCTSLLLLLPNTDCLQQVWRLFHFMYWKKIHFEILTLTKQCIFLFASSPLRISLKLVYKWLCSFISLAKKDSVDVIGLKCKFSNIMIVRNIILQWQAEREGSFISIRKNLYMWLV